MHKSISVGAYFFFTRTPDTLRECLWHCRIFMMFLGITLEIAQLLLEYLVSMYILVRKSYWQLSEERSSSWAVYHCCFLENASKAMQFKASRDQRAESTCTCVVNSRINAVRQLVNSWHVLVNSTYSRSKKVKLTARISTFYYFFNNQIVVRELGNN